MTTQTTSPRLTPKFAEALAYVYEKHGAQTRKGGDIPYLGHLLTVAGFVIDADGTEAQAIAALLHDAAEDQGGEPTLAEIRDKFGDEVADIVDECSDTVETPKPPWRERSSVTSTTCPRRRTEPSWCRWPTSCTTLMRSCVTSVRTATSCGNGSTSRTRNSTCGTTAHCSTCTPSASTTGWSTSCAR
jgi:HD domain